MILSAGEDTITINNPEYGYIAYVNMAISVVETEHGYQLWDNGIGYDHRTCKVDRFLFSDTEAATLETFLNSHRGEIIALTLGTDSGFFPFGPDKGDTGIFTIKVLERNFTLYDQFNQFTKSFKWLMVSAPAYTLPAITRQGNFSIGGVDYLMYPQTGISQGKEYGLSTSVTLGGDGYYVDKKVNVTTSGFTQNCNEGLAAALFAYMTGSNGRASDITIENAGRYYIFGVENGASDSYLCKNISPVIQCEHVGNEQFEIPLTFWLKQ